jgi:hypothetical protein
MNAATLALSEKKETDQIIERPENKSETVEASMQEEINLADIEEEEATGRNKCC